MKIAFVTNFCPHYRVRTFEILARHFDVDFYFFSRGQERYWQREHGVRRGDFNLEYLDGFRLGGTRITPSLVSRLWRGRYDAIVKCINGRFAVPATYGVARARGIPMILWTEIWSHPRTPFHIVTSPLTRKLYDQVGAIVVPGENVLNYLGTLGVDVGKVFVAPHCVDNDVYSQRVPAGKVRELRKRLALRPDRKVVLYLGRLERGKGLKYLIDAFSVLGHLDADLLFVGKGTFEPELRRRVKELRLDERVRFAGYVPPEETPAYYALAYIAVLPSITTRAGKEPWGLTVNEAMNQGVPIVASEAVGAAAGGLVRDGFSGYVVPERDSALLGERLERLIKNVPLREELGENARRLVSGWNNEAMVMGFCRAIAYARGGDPAPWVVQATSEIGVGQGTGESH